MKGKIDILTQNVVTDEMLLSISNDSLAILSVHSLNDNNYNDGNNYNFVTRPASSEEWLVDCIEAVLI